MKFFVFRLKFFSFAVKIHQSMRSAPLRIDEKIEIAMLDDAAPPCKIFGLTRRGGLPPGSVHPALAIYIFYLSHYFSLFHSLICFPSCHVFSH